MTRPLDFDLAVAAVTVFMVGAPPDAFLARGRIAAGQARGS